MNGPKMFLGLGEIFRNAGIPIVSRLVAFKDNSAM